MPGEWPGGQSRPARRSGAASVELDDNLALYDEVGQLLILLNTSAAEVWERCDGATTLHDIARQVAAAHSGDAAVIGEDVRQTVGKLAELGLVVDAAGTTGGAPAA